MLLGFFKLPKAEVQAKPRDLVEFDKARANQRRTLKQVGGAADVLSGLVRNMKGPVPPTPKMKRTRT